MKNSAPLGERIAGGIVTVVSILALIPLVLALVALAHGAAIPFARWLAPLLIVVAGLAYRLSRRPVSWLLGGVWVGLVIAYVYKYLGA
jgi:hypothetical protein